MSLDDDVHEYNNIMVTRESGIVIDICIILSCAVYYYIWSFKCGTVFKRQGQSVSCAQSVPCFHCFKNIITILL